MAYSGSRSQSSLSVCICQVGVIIASRFFGQRCSKMVSARCLSRCPALRAHLSRVSHYCVGVGKGGGRSVGSCPPASGVNCWALCVTWALSPPRVTSLQGPFKSRRRSPPGGQSTRSSRSATSCRFWTVTGTTRSPCSCSWPRSCALNGQ